MVSKKDQKKKGDGSSQQIDPIQAAIDYGIDVSMLRENLKRSPAERIRRHQIALEAFKALRKAKRV